MLLEFPDDPACDTLDRQYMLGDNLLVAPVFSSDGSVVYYVPAGCWTNILDGKVIQGPRWVREPHGVMSLPLLARPNSILPIGEHDDTPDYEYADGVRLQIYELEEGKTALLRDSRPSGEHPGDLRGQPPGRYDQHPL